MSEKKNTDSKRKEHVGMTYKKSVDFSEWYTQLITESEMIEYYDVSAYGIWEAIQTFINKEIKLMGVKNAYFPMFVPAKALATEKDHVEGFSAEVAWVTRSGKSELAEPIALRPTSETVMYPAFKNWIRWEFKCPTPFIRSREFLWQEGHCAFATRLEAEINVKKALDLYKTSFFTLYSNDIHSVFEGVLAVPVIQGQKTETEKFAGGLYTASIEAYIPGQAATSHCLGQNFSKMFEIMFETPPEVKSDSDSKIVDISNDPFVGSLLPLPDEIKPLDSNGSVDKQHSYAWQTSWGLTTRAIGIAIMGLVLPPRVSPVQVVFVPVYGPNSETGLRVNLDNKCIGWKYNYWDLKGVPIRIELGPKELENNKVSLVRRDDKTKKRIDVSMKWDELTGKISEILTQIQESLLDSARTELNNHKKRITTFKDMIDELLKNNIVLAPFCCDTKCEQNIKERIKNETKVKKDETKEVRKKEKKIKDESKNKNEEEGLAVKTLNIPYEENSPQITLNEYHCVGCNKVDGLKWVIFGRSY